MDDREGRGVGPLGHQDVDGPAAIHQGIAGGDVAGVLHGGHVAQVNRGVGAHPDRNCLQLLDVANQRVDRDDRHELADPDVARGADRVAVGQGRDQLVGRERVGPQPLRIGPDDHGALVAAEGRGRRDPRQAGEHRADLEKRLVLDLADRLGLAREHEIAHGNAAGVEPGDEGRDGARRHEGARASDVADRLGHRLGHVGAGMEEQLHHRHALDVPALDVMDARDVKKVILVIVGEQPLHLGWVHAAVGLGDVDDRQIQVGEDVDRHPCHGQRTAQHDGYDKHHDREGPPHGKGDRVHWLGPPECDEVMRLAWSTQSGQLALGSKLMIDDAGSVGTRGFRYGLSDALWHAWQPVRVCL